MSTHDDLLVYAETDSPLGRLLVAATGKGVCRLAFELEGFETVLDQLEQKTGLEPKPTLSPVLKDALTQLQEYFAGARKEFTVPLDYALMKGFRGQIQYLLPTIAWGETVTYGQLAARAGKPGAARAVGSACADNPIPLFLPCHRVVRSDGTTGNYLAGPGAKQLLLQLEGRNEG